jgi:3-oxoacyl-[acyl-carrier-protein] synthase II
VSPSAVVTGVGAVTPLGNGADTLAERWIAGEHAIVDGVARCTEFDPRGALDRKELSRADRFSQLALVAADEACRDAGWLDDLPCEGERVGVVVGTCFGGHEAHSRFTRDVSERGAVSPFALPMIMPNAAPALIAMRLRATGPNYSVGTACAAGSDAIGIAAKMIESGVIDAAVVGGAEACVSELLVTASLTMGAMSKSGICRPFDRRRDGFVIGEGAAILTLERADLAAERGADVLAEVLGYGCTADAHHLTNPEPNARQAALAIRQALDQAELHPFQVDYVNAHGTSTPLNDRIEARALDIAFGDSYQLPVSSTKSAIGHLVGAAGAAEAVATIGALRRATLPPNIGHEYPDEGLELDCLPRSRHVIREPERSFLALSNSFGFGGHNSVLCLRIPQAAAAQQGAEERVPAHSLGV